MSTRILRGDCRDILKTLENESVHCVVTSPPYFGLRDYGTAQWDGGDPACDHTGVARRCDNPGRNDKQSTQRGSSSDRISRDCLHCGAIRIDSQIGLEPTPDAFVSELVAVFREVRRVLRKDGTAWLNLGDSYAADRSATKMPAETLAGGINGHSPGLDRGRSGLGAMSRRDAPSIGLKHKDLCGIPWRVAFALQADGWYLRQDIIWSKPNPMPESVRDRCTKAHEYIFLLARSERYFYDAEAIAEPAIRAGCVVHTAEVTDRTRELAKTGYDGHRTRVGISTNDRPVGENRNKRSVWEVATQPFPEAHFATFPPALIEPCIKAGCPVNGTVLDPFGGAGTTGLVADRLARNAILIELNPEYADMAERRIRGDAPLFAQVG